MSCGGLTLAGRHVPMKLLYQSCSIKRALHKIQQTSSQVMITTGTPLTVFLID